MLNTTQQTITETPVPEDSIQVKQETQSTVSIGTLLDEEVQQLEDGRFLIPCNICQTVQACDSDESQCLPCNHLWIELKDAKNKKRFASKMEEMVFRMKAVMQGHDDPANKQAVDDFYETNNTFMAKYPMYGRYKTGLQNLALIKKKEKKTFKSKWSRVRSKIKSLTWIYKSVSNGQ